MTELPTRMSATDPDGFTVLPVNEVSGRLSGLVVEPMAFQHEDPRRAIFEAVLDAPAGVDFRRFTLLKIHGPQAGALGQHYHPYPEVFVLFSGTYLVYLEDVDTGERFAFEVDEPCVLVLPARVAHTFVPSVPGMLMHGAAVPQDDADFIKYVLV